jgi:hypothetical protein
MGMTRKEKQFLNDKVYPAVRVTMPDMEKSLARLESKLSGCSCDKPEAVEGTVLQDAQPEMDAPEKKWGTDLSPSPGFTPKPVVAKPKQAPKKAKGRKTAKKEK